MALAVRTSVRSCLLVLFCLACVPREQPRKEPVPEDAEELFQLGEAHAARGNFLHAEQYMATALRAGYESPTAIHQLLEVCLEGSFLRAGVEHARWFLSRHPDDTNVRLSLAALYYGLGEFSHASTELRIVLDKDADRPNAHYLSGAVAIAQGAQDIESAQYHWERYLELAPTGPRAIEVELKLREIRRGPKRAEFPGVQVQELAADAGTPDSASSSTPSKVQASEQTP